MGSSKNSTTEVLHTVANTPFLYNIFLVHSILKNLDYWSVCPCRALKTSFPIWHSGLNKKTKTFVCLQSICAGIFYKSDLTFKIEIDNKIINKVEITKLGILIDNHAEGQDLMPVWSSFGSLSYLKG